MSAQPQQPGAPQIPMTGIDFMSPDEVHANAAMAVRVTPDDVRQELLLAIKRCAENVTMPLGNKPPKEWSQAALQLSQAYLLLDPSVDSEGVPLAHHIELNAAAQAIAAENKPKTEDLKGARADTPKPQPRVQ
jgi:hypothetical protein